MRKALLRCLLAWALFSKVALSATAHECSSTLQLRKAAKPCPQLAETLLTGAFRYDCQLPCYLWGTATTFRLGGASARVCTHGDTCSAPDRSFEALGIEAMC